MENLKKGEFVMSDTQSIKHIDIDESKIKLI